MEADLVQYGGRKELKRVKHFVVGHRLGKGSYGTVKEALNEETNQRVALKICKEQTLRRIPGAWHIVEEEIRVLSTLHHRNVIELHSHWKDAEQKKIYMELEYVGGGSLGGQLKRLASRKLSEEQARWIFTDLIAGLEYLHSQDVVHGDIKPDNLLLTKDGHIKISDFGVSIRRPGSLSPSPVQSDHSAGEELSEGSLFGHARYGRGQGTPAFQPPEVISGQMKFSACGERLDLWAAGLVLYILTAGEYPFASKSVGPLVDQISSAVIKYPEHMSGELTNLLQQILAKVDTRSTGNMTLQEIKSHAWFSGEKEPLEVQTYPSVFEQRRRGGYRVANSSPTRGSQCQMM